MKRRTAKLSDSGMRFFTPELYVRFNSDDDAIADQANAQWDVALNAYSQHLAELKPNLPRSAQSLAELPLHDAEVLASEFIAEPLPPVESVGPFPIWSAITVLSLRFAEQITSLIYLVSDRVREYPPPEAWPFSAERIHCLYDELDRSIGRQGHFTHRYLFSDGRVMEIPFVGVVVHRMPLASQRMNTLRPTA